MSKETTFRNIQGSDEPAYLIVKRKSRHRDFVIFKRHGLTTMLDPNLGVNDLRLIIWMCLQIEPGTDYIISCSQLIISQALNMSQPAVSNSLRCLFLLGIIKKGKLESGFNIWIPDGRFVTRKRND